MNALRTTAVAVLSLTVLSTARAEEKAPAKGDLAKLEGSWTAMGGPEKDTKIRLTFKGAVVTMVLTPEGDQDQETTGEITLDETAKPHKTINWRGFKKPDGEPLGEILSIYEFDGDDSLRVCSCAPGGTERPTEFKAGEGGSHLLTFTREGGKAADTSAPKGDLAKFQGSWKAMVGPNKDIPLTFTFKGSTVAISFTSPNGENITMNGEVKLDDSAKPHKTIDWVKFNRPDGEAAPDNPGIYEFESDDSLKLCSGGPGNQRPSEFKAGEEGRPPHFVVAKREKK